MNIFTFLAVVWPHGMRISTSLTNNCWMNLRKDNIFDWYNSTFDDLARKIATRIFTKSAIPGIPNPSPSLLAGERKSLVGDSRWTKPLLYKSREIVRACIKQKNIGVKKIDFPTDQPTEKVEGFI